MDIVGTLAVEADGRDTTVPVLTAGLSLPVAVAGFLFGSGCRDKCAPKPTGKISREFFFGGWVLSTL
jgi:hypothetical protein